MRPGSAIAIGGALVLLAASARPAFGPRYGGEARVSVATMPAAFAAAPARGAAARLVSALVHERLVDVGPGGTLVPGLAEGWTESAEGREVTIRLRAAAVFHDGAPVRPFDVARSLHAFLRSPAPAAGRLAAALDGLAYGDDAVVLRLRDPFPLALAALAAPEAAVTSPQGAGAGPFVPTTRAPIRGTGRFVAFSRHVRGRPFLDAIALDAEPAGAAALAPSAGEGAPAATLLLVLDPRRPPFTGEAVRRRIAAGIDAADLRRHFLAGGAPSGLIPPTLLPDPGPAPARAAGRATGAIGLAVATDVAPEVSQRVVALLSAAGLKVSPLPEPPERAWEIPAAARLVLFTPAVADPLLALDELVALAGAPELARASRDEAARTPDRAAREALVRRAEAEVRAAAVAIPLAALPVGFRAPADLHGAFVDAAGRIRLEDAWLEP
jgi:ABC-type transport system substrate-binding protein